MARKSYTRGNAASPSRRSPLLLIVVAGAVVLVLAGLVLLLSRPSPTGTSGGPAETARGPRLAVDQEKIDFGEVKVNQMVKARFVLTNAGDQPLQIAGEPAVRVVEGC